MNRYILIFFICIIFGKTLQAQATSKLSGPDDRWYAQWITHPKVDVQSYGVYYFRKILTLDTKVKTYPIHLTADNRYHLMVNGQSVCRGPAVSDPQHWYYESLDIANYLQKGDNEILVKVWQKGKYRPQTQMSRQLALIVQGHSLKEVDINTGNGHWEVMRSEAHHPVPIINMVHVRGGYLAGAGDSIITDKRPEKAANQIYQPAQALEHGQSATQATSKNYDCKKHQWLLMPRPIPLLENHLEEPPILVKAKPEIDIANYEQKNELIIPPNSHYTLLLDQGYLTIGYPEIQVKGGKNASLRLCYAEALFLPNQKDSTGAFVGEGQLKGNRNKIDNKEMVGNYDIWFLDGTTQQLSPLRYRCFRYLECQIKTDNEPLIISSLRNRYMVYPLKEKARFETDDKALHKIWEVGWRTARLCAHETYMDCPYYEQLQYIGDTRIQALISLYVSGDDRLVRNAIQQFHWSQAADSLTMCRYPSVSPCVIPPFSLFWTAMVYDYWQHRADTAFVKQFLPAIEKVLDWHLKYIDNQTGMLGKMPYWHFVDWPKEWAWDPAKGTGGIPAGATEGRSSVLSLQLAYSLKLATGMLHYFGEDQQADYYNKVRRKLCRAIYKQCWDKEKKMIADTPDKQIFSQHANIMAVLSDCVEGRQANELMYRIVQDSSLIQTTIYYRFYLNRALQACGAADLYLDLLAPWQDMIDLGLTTFAEKPEPTRSDCHAWSASPNYDFLALICGIRPSAPGFERICIEPAMGHLNYISAKMPHPWGLISVKLQRQDSQGLKAEVNLPASLTGVFIWQGKEKKLTGGYNNLTF